MFGTPETPRLVVFRSNKQIYAQVVDDLKGTTLVSASSLEIKGAAKKAPSAMAKTSATGSKKSESKATGEGGKVAVAGKVGELLAEKCKKAKIAKVVFDRAGYKFHGRVASLAEAARNKGLKL